MAVVGFSGLASGIDTKSLIDAYLEQQRASRVEPLRKKISALQDSSAALEELGSLLQELRGAVDKMRALNGSVLSKSAASSNESRVAATASNAAVNGSHSLHVLTVAKNANFSFDDRYGSATAVIGGTINDSASVDSRTVTVQVGAGDASELVTVEVTSATTLSDFVSQFNAESSRAEASVVNVGTSDVPSYALAINSTAEGTALGQIAVSVGSEITNTGAFTASTISQAADATFTISGISGTITRGSNSVSDIISGVTFSLKSVGAATVTVSDDAATTATSMRGFVDALNALRSFIAENDLVTRDEESQSSIFGPLASVSLDENLMGSLRNALLNASNPGSTVATLSDLGITTERDGALKLTDSVLFDALSRDPEGVRSITLVLGEELGGVQGLISQYTRFGGLIDSAQSTFSDEREGLNRSIERAEELLALQKGTMTSQYARLESVIGRMSSQQSALAALKTIG